MGFCGYPLGDSSGIISKLKGILIVVRYNCFPPEFSGGLNSQRHENSSFNTFRSGDELNF